MRKLEKLKLRKPVIIVLKILGFLLCSLLVLFIIYRNQINDLKKVKGIGEKTAQKLLAEYKTLDNVLANCENIQQKSLKEKICSGKEIAKLRRDIFG